MLFKRKKKNGNYGKKESDFIFGSSGSGMCHRYAIPLSPNIKMIEGYMLLSVLCYRGEIVDYEQKLSDAEIYIMLQNARMVLGQCIFLRSNNVVRPNERPISYRQMYCAELAISFIMEGRYNAALHEFSDVIDDYGKGRNRTITMSELALYNSILTCFISKIEHESPDIENLRILANNSIHTEEWVEAVDSDVKGTKLRNIKKVRDHLQVETETDFEYNFFEGQYVSVRCIPGCSHLDINGQIYDICNEYIKIKVKHKKVICIHYGFIEQIEGGDEKECST